MIHRPNVKRCEHFSKKCQTYCLRDDDFLQDIKDVFDEGELVVYPTETLYALGADPFNDTALNKLFEVKKRPRNMPVSLAVSGIGMMRSVAEVNFLAEKIHDKFLPGPVTLILKKKDIVLDALTGGGEKIGIRVPKHPVALKIINKVGPITSTSANLHGYPEPKNLEMALEQLGNGAMLYLDCGKCEYGAASTVVDISDSSIKIIREGVIPLGKLYSISDQQL